MSEDLKKLRFSLRTLNQDYEKSEDDIKALQSVGQIIGEVLKALDDERCAYGCPAQERPFRLILWRTISHAQSS